MNELANRYAAEEVDELHDAAFGEEIVELRRGIDRLEAQVARRVAVFKRRQATAMGRAGRARGAPAAELCDLRPPPSAPR